MPKPAKKPATKKAPAKPAKKAAKKASSAKPSAARTRAATATPARAMTRKRVEKSEITALIGSVTADDISMRAYFIGERRRHLGLPGDPQSDWLEAERQLRG
jgi:hypothetical protein